MKKLKLTFEDKLPNELAKVIRTPNVNTVELSFKLGLLNVR